MTIKEIVAAYNEIAIQIDVPVVKKFRDKATAERRLAEIQAKVPAQVEEPSTIDADLVAAREAYNAKRRGETCVFRCGGKKFTKKVYSHKGGTKAFASGIWWYLGYSRRTGFFCSAPLPRSKSCNNFSF